MEQMKCPECGKDISPNSKQCNYCGFSIKKGAKRLVIVWVCASVIIVAMLATTINLLLATKAIANNQTVVTNKDVVESTLDISSFSPTPIISPTPIPAQNPTPIPVGEMGVLQLSDVVKRKEGIDITSVSVFRYSKSRTRFIFEFSEHTSSATLFILGKLSNTGYDRISINKYEHISADTRQLTVEIPTGSIRSCNYLEFTIFEKSYQDWSFSAVVNTSTLRMLLADQEETTKSQIATETPVTTASQENKNEGWKSTAVYLGELFEDSFSDFNPTYRITDEGIYITTNYGLSDSEIKKIVSSSELLQYHTQIKDSLLKTSKETWNFLKESGYDDKVYYIELISSDGNCVMEFLNGVCKYDLAEE